MQRCNVGLQVGSGGQHLRGQVPARRGVRRDDGEGSDRRNHEGGLRSGQRLLSGAHLFAAAIPDAFSGLDLECPDPVPVTENCAVACGAVSSACPSAGSVDTTGQGIVTCASTAQGCPGTTCPANVPGAPGTLVARCQGGKVHSGSCPITCPVYPPVIGVAKCVVGGWSYTASSGLGSCQAQAPPSVSPTKGPSTAPSTSPLRSPSRAPSTSPSRPPSARPSQSPTGSPLKSPTASPVKSPTGSPVKSPTTSPARSPSRSPTRGPSASPAAAPTRSPTAGPAPAPTRAPSASPLRSPSRSPSTAPSRSPITPGSPTQLPSAGPAPQPTAGPAPNPTKAPLAPTTSPSRAPQPGPTKAPSAAPEKGPTRAPTTGPRPAPTAAPYKPGQPSRAPVDPTASPSAPPLVPTAAPSAMPTTAPAAQPSTAPASRPTAAPERQPVRPTMAPAARATPSLAPTLAPMTEPDEPLSVSRVGSGSFTESDVNGDGYFVVRYRVTGGKWRADMPADSVVLSSTLSGSMYPKSVAGALRNVSAPTVTVSGDILTVNISVSGYSLGAGIVERESIEVSFKPAALEGADAEQVTAASGWRNTVRIEGTSGSVLSAGKAVATVAGVTTLLAGGSGGAAMSLGRMAIVTSVRCGDEDDVLDPEATPWEVVLWHGQYSHFGDAIIGNLLIVLIPTFLHFLTALVVSVVKKKTQVVEEPRCANRSYSQPLLKPAASEAATFEELGYKAGMGDTVGTPLPNLRPDFENRAVLITVVLNPGAESRQRSGQDADRSPGTPLTLASSVSASSPPCPLRAPRVRPILGPAANGGTAMEPSFRAPPPLPLAPPHPRSDASPKPATLGTKMLLRLGVSKADFQEARSDVRYPHYVLMIVLFTYQGTAACALKLIIYGSEDGVGQVVFGVLVLLLWNCGFIWLIKWKLRKVEAATYQVNDMMGRGGTWDTGRVALYFLGPGEWVSAGRAKLVQRWGLFLEAYAPHSPRFLIVECSVLLILSILVVNPLRANSFPACASLSFLCFAILLGFTGLCLFRRPWASSYDNQGNSFLNVLQTVAMLGISIGFAVGDVEHPVIDVTEWLLLAITAATFFKCLIDLALLVYDICSRRRDTLQDEYNAADEADATEGGDEEMEQTARHPLPVCEAI
eukprot:TRINITY_DN5728_c0_g2_i3.p1 TRINITY_DN5728_c0_g2~~TRINITY_DN5728_c0_g2_i3.p1  ORF type:complete len:1143 (+),score=181.70 TRINITY_DN5728_c0_g2_i3:767-4195(+)